MHNAQDVYDEVTKIPPPNGDCHVNHRDSDVLAVGDGHALVSASVCGQESIVLQRILMVVCQRMGATSSYSTGQPLKQVLLGVETKLPL